MLVGSSAAANCWNDSTLSARTLELARRHYPSVALQMPQILVCTADQFGPNIGGTYSSGIHQIRIPVWQLSRPDLSTVLAHELGHAQNEIDGVQNGHSVEFMKALIRAGFAAEASRVAAYTGGHDALADAHAQLVPRYRAPAVTADAPPPTVYVPPRVTVLVCEDTTIVFHIFDHQQRRWRRASQVQRRCRETPQ